jgi:Fe-S-cluster formation regulator IscX/YfhJ
MEGLTDLSPRRKPLQSLDPTIRQLGGRVRYTQLRQQIMRLTACSKRTAQLAITEACQQGWIVQADSHYCSPLSRDCGFGGEQ